MSFIYSPQPAEQGKALLKWLLVLLISIGLLGAGVFVLLAQIPSIGEQLPENAAPILVRLDQPQGFTSTIWSSEVSLNVEAFSDAPLERLELWANGQLVAEFQAEQASAAYWETGWTPGAVGEYNLFVRAYDRGGRSAASNVLRITSLETPGAFFDYTVKQGDSLESIAEFFTVEPTSLEQANPALDMLAGTSIVIPIAQASAPQAQPVSPSAGLVNLSPGNHVIDDLKFWLKDLIGSSGDLPPAPFLSAAFSTQAAGCDVQLTIRELSDQAFGYFIYRADGSGNFQRIASLERGNGNSLSYNDPDRRGLETYYAAAFNPAGESPSAPVSVDPAALNCGAAAGTPVLQLHGSMLTIPGGIESVYFYISINYGEWQRAPALDGWFLPVEDQQVDISPLLTGFDQLPPHTSLRLEVWGWSSGVLTKIGSLDTLLSSTELFGCPTPGVCLQGLGWTNQLTIYPEAEDHQVEFTWSTDALGAASGIWQVSTEPFPDNYTLTPPGLLVSGPAGAASSGNPANGSRFILDIGDLADLLDDPTQLEMHVPNLETGWLLNGLSLSTKPSFLPGLTGEGLNGLVFYVRVIPLSGNEVVGEPSDPVVVYYQPEIEQVNPLVEYPVPPDIYDIEVVEFTPIVPPTLDWGCMVIREIDHDTFVSHFFSLTESAEDAYERYAAAMNSQTPICPSSYMGVGEKPWYESMWDFASSALSWVSEAYESIKSEVISTIASSLDALPLVECGSGCEALLKQGLNAGMVALGIPPELPNLDELTEQGMDYLVETVAAEAGIDCDETCREIIRDGIEEFVEQAQQATVKAVCQDVEYAHAHGKEPLCLPEGITATPAPGSVTQPATVTIQITRKPEPAEVESSFLDEYTYRLNFNAETYIGSDTMLVQVNTGFYEGSYGATFYGASLPIDDPLKGPLFLQVDGPIPAIAPGETIDLTFGLQASDYWIPGHKDLIAAEGGFVLYNDFWDLYYGANLEINGNIICPWYDPIYQPTIQCGGSDTFQYAIP
jgi:LysM repeat protein